MTKTEAHALGHSAALNGQPPSPLAHAAMLAEITGAKVGEKTHLMRAYNKGWQAAHWTVTDAAL